MEYPAPPGGSHPSDRALPSLSGALRISVKIMYIAVMYCKGHIIRGTTQLRRSGGYCVNTEYIMVQPVPKQRSSFLPVFSRILW